MSNVSTPQSSSGYASPFPMSTPPLSKPIPPKAKPTNVFTNDGSFLERFQSTRKEEEEKKKEQEALEKSYSLLDSSGHLTDLFWPTRKRNFDNRFKNRGKRPLPDSTLDSEPAPDDLPVKKIKSDGYPTDHQREIKTLDGRSLKNSGTGVRPLVK